MKMLCNRRWVPVVLVAAAALSLAGYALARPSSTPRRRGRLTGVPLAQSGHDQAQAGDRIAIQAIYDAAGDPSLGANFDGTRLKPRFAICSPPNVDVCRLAADHTQFLAPGPTPVGTVFQATARSRGRTYFARSAPWLGTVRATTAPRLDGRARDGAKLIPRAAVWAGGWQTDPRFHSHDGAESGGRGPNFDQLNVEACRTRVAQHCVDLSTPATLGPHSATVGGWFTGWYLFAVDQRFAYDTAFATPAYDRPADIPPARPGATVAFSAALGPVVGPPAPEVSILHEAILRHGRVLVARVRCPVRCQISLQVSDAHYLSSARLTLTASDIIGVPQRQLGPDRLDVQFYADGGPPINGTSRLP